MTEITREEVRKIKGSTCPTMQIIPPDLGNNPMTIKPDVLIRKMVHMPEDERNFCLILLSMQISGVLTQDAFGKKFDIREEFQTLQATMDLLTRMSTYLNCYDRIIEDAALQGHELFTPEEGLELVLRDFAQDLRKELNDDAEEEAGA